MLKEYFLPSKNCPLSHLRNEVYAAHGVMGNFNSNFSFQRIWQQFSYTTWGWPSYERKRTRSLNFPAKSNSCNKSCRIVDVMSRRGFWIPEDSRLLWHWCDLVFYKVNWERFGGFVLKCWLPGKPKKGGKIQTWCSFALITGPPLRLYQLSMHNFSLWPEGLWS